MSIDALTNIIAGGQPADINRDTLAEQTKQAIDGLFGSRYQARSRCSVRAALMPGADAVSFAGLVHEDSCVCLDPTTYRRLHGWLKLVR